MRRQIAGLAAAVAFLVLPAPDVQAKGGYPLAQALESCKAHEKRERRKFPGTAIFAANSLGGSTCLYTDYPLAQAKANAVKACDRQSPAALRGKAPCRVVALNGKLVDSGFYRAMTRDYRIAVHIRSWNGADKREEEMEGYVIFGRSDMSGSTPVNEARLIRDDGLEICKGWVKSVGLGQSLGFTVDCIGGHRLTGTARLTGLIKVDGLNRAGAFRATIRNPPHKMEFWTK